tara:strand:- start:8062 stop:8928 length:867 start_codon:yes stop_codon:yes gene_type:complete
MNNIHQNVTQEIINAMKKATEFEMPWHCQDQLPINAVTNKAYSGINTVSLWANGLRSEFKSNQWATYKQWQSIGGQVNRGEKGSGIIIYKPLPTDDNEKAKVLIRSATVFNVEQVSNVDDLVGQPDLIDKTERLKVVDDFIKKTNAKINIQGNKAYYIPSTDEIYIPDREQFKGTLTSDPTECYYSTLLHELIHWTGHQERCERDLSSRFGSDGYAMEELIAELGAAFLCAELNITQSVRQDHANYINNWVSVLEHDEKAIFWASARASEAAVYLRSIQPKQVDVFSL